MLLAIDTSSKAASCALIRDNVLVAESFVNAGLTHSQTAMSMTEAMLKSCGVAIKEIDKFAVSVGPGSFTGLRIGIALVKGMAMALGRPCAGISTLYGLAANVSGCFSGYIVPVMDARRSQVYTAIFRCTAGALERVTPDDTLSVDQVAEQIMSFDAPILLLGDGAELHFSQMTHSGRGILAPVALRHQRAASVGFVAIQMDQFYSADELMPVYLRVPQAERERLTALGAPLPLTAR